MIDGIALQCHLILFVHKVLNHNQRTLYLLDSIFQFLLILADIHIKLPATGVRRNILGDDRIPQVLRQWIILTNHVTVQHIESMLLGQLLNLILIHKLIDSSISPGIVRNKPILPLIIVQVKVTNRLVIREYCVRFLTCLSRQITILLHQQFETLLHRVHTVEFGDILTTCSHLIPALHRDIHRIDTILTKGANHIQWVIVL